MMYNPSKWRNFTLLELLIVIAVIAILAGLLLPALQQAKIKAQAAQCLNQLKQLGTCVSFYSSDYSGFFPGIGPTLPNYRMAKSWRMTLGEYIGKTDKSYAKIFLCARASADPDHVDTYESNQSVNINSYAMNKSLARQRSEKVKNSSGKMYLADVWNTKLSGGEAYFGYESDYLTWNVSRRHRNGCNILWADLHVSNSLKQAVHDSKYINLP